MTTLARFPEILRAVVAAVPEEQWRTRGPNDFFALVEHAHHLADLEEEGYARRIERLLREDRPSLPDFAGDVIAQERRYIDQPLLPALERFCATRDANVARFATLTEEEWTRSGTQEILGVEIPTVTLAVAPGRNLAVLVEAAVRNHILITRGIDSTREFIARQEAQIRAESGEAG